MIHSYRVATFYGMTSAMSANPSGLIGFLNSLHIYIYEETVSKTNAGGVIEQLLLPLRDPGGSAYKLT